MQQRAKILTIQLYRLRPGDVGIKNIPAVGEDDLASAKKATADALTNYFNDSNRPGPSKPHHARLLDEDGSVIAEFDMRPGGVHETPVRVP